MHPCLKCGNPERKELKEFNEVVHRQKIGKVIEPVHAGFFPQTRVFSILCKNCIDSARVKRHRL